MYGHCIYSHRSYPNKFIPREKSHIQRPLIRGHACALYMPSQSDRARRTDRSNRAKVCDRGMYYCLFPKKR